METESIKSVLMRRDNMSEIEADSLIDEAKEQLTAYLAEGNWMDAYYICQEFFGLEPDYLDELLYSVPTYGREKTGLATA